MEFSNMEKVLNYQILRIQGVDYLIALGVFLVLSLVFSLIQRIALQRIKDATIKTETDVDDFLLQVFQHIKPPFYSIVSLYIATRFLILNELFSQIVYGVFIITIVVQVTLIFQKVIDYSVKKRLSMIEGGGKDEESITKLISQVVKASLWVVGGLLILSNLGVDITSLVAGFGIGGIAIAIAVQNVLGDVFASFSIFIDKPFGVGDSIRTGTDSGTVQKIGIKTTRIKTLTGSELVIPNKELTDSRIHNLKRIKKRRTSFSLGIVYNTKPDKLKEIPIMIEKIINKIEGVKFSRAHFKAFSDSSLDFEIVYFIDNPGYKNFMDIQQEINLGIYEKFEKENIEFAFPTQTLFLNKNN